jgi:hypothetical protein
MWFKFNESRIAQALTPSTYSLDERFSFISIEH